MVVGVSGRYCAGKSEVSRMLVEEGYERLDVDRQGHQALVSERERVLALFGERIIGESGEIDRRKLGEIVFRDEEARTRLEEIVHPVMRERVDARAEESRRRGERLVIDAALLFYMGLHTVCDKVLWVDAPGIVRLWRALKRDKLSLPLLLSRFRAQRQLTPQPYMHDVDIRRVNNWGSRARLYRQVAEVPGVLPER
ncbi:MAG: dephospho-CoA kinase [Alkalispirochaetaceae bacterium]